MKAASVADLAVGRWEGAETTIAVEAECFSKIGALRVKGASFIVGDGDLFSGFDVTYCVDGLALCIAVPTIMSIWKTAVINEANDRVDSPNSRVRAAGQSVYSDDTTEWVLAREVIVKGEELSLLGLRKCL